MSKVKNENFIIIQGFMVNELNLKGNELLVYAIIYGFSQEENQVFNGSLQYLADWTNSTKQGVLKNLKSLVEKGYIKKNDKVINGVKFCEYYVTKFNRVDNEVKQDIKQSSTKGIKQSLPNNKASNKKNNIKEIIKELVEDEDIIEALFEFLEMRKLIKKPMTERAIRQLIAKLFELATTKSDRLKILENSIINNWASVYPLQKEKGKRREIEPEWIDKKDKPKQGLSDEYLERVRKLKEELQSK